MTTNFIKQWIGRPAALPPLSIEVDTVRSEDDRDVVPEPTNAAAPQPISALLCLIDYKGETRLISCRRFDVIGQQSYVGAICHSAKAYRQFRCDRISTVSDAQTGEVLGDGSYFERFSVTSSKEASPSWGLPPSRKAVLVAGLNILAFMARCDGQRHPLETDPIERFITSMWLRKEWEGDPPLDDIIKHAQRLAPDADTFFRALNYYARSETSSRIIKNAVSELIAADGIICATENDWAYELAEYLNEKRENSGAEDIEQWIARELG